MELVRGLHNLRPRHRSCVVTIGNYDGVHLGHQAMLQSLRAHAERLKVPATVMCFEPSPLEFLRSKTPDACAPARLTRFREKFHELALHGVERMVCARFDARMQMVTPQAFVDDILVKGLGARWVVVGNDFRFAQARAGTVALLRERGAALGFGVDEIAPYLVNGERVSSSLVRAALAAGDMSRAKQLLGRPYRMFGKVIAGKRLGRTLGFPTANLRLHRRIIPMMGVFAVRVTGAGLNAAPAVANLGTRPVVNGQEPLLEAHVFDFDGDLYGQNLRVEFIARLRDERWFPNLNELTIQMKEDAAQARLILM
ncbi:MAG: bifunctional riboflavin kinase/FAD synthetase [Candidatus Obscuribacterales bacterium]|nr:bifunctional riboflavin kinase/FAD synthetase [Steroidobacteraceae bacterium]